MATELFTFATKYRLDIRDVEGAYWRIDIEEKDYVGSVTSFIGDGTAFEITWENNENYNKTIIGSYCRINLMAKPVFDSGTPDFTDLFTVDETKYRVKIYSSTILDPEDGIVILNGIEGNQPYSTSALASANRSLTNNFISYVTVADPLSVGKLEGATLYTDQAKTTTVPDGFWRVRVESGGIFSTYVIQTTSGVVGSLTLDGSGYELYWQGFIVQDEYVEQVTSDPYVISIIATDNFGKLKRFNYKDNDPSKHEDYNTYSEILYDGLTNIGLAIDVNDLSGFDITSLFPSLSQFTIQANAFLDQTYNDYNNVYEIISSYLKATNSIMTQAYGELYIVSKASYHSVINGNFDWKAWKLTFGASSFAITPIEPYNVPVNTGLDIPSQLRVFNRSLIKTRRSANQVTVNNNRIKNKNLLFNGSFELDADSNGNVVGWKGYDPVGLTFGDIDFTLATRSIKNFSTDTGERSFRNSFENKITGDAFIAANEATRNTTYTLLESDTGFTTDSAGNIVNPYPVGIPFSQNHSSGENYELEVTLSFSLFLEDSGDVPVNCYFSLYSKGGFYYDFQNKEWVASHRYGVEVLEEVGKWVNVQRTIPRSITDGLGINTNEFVFRLHTISKEDSAAVNGYFYIDDVSLKVSQPEGSESAITLGVNTYSAQVANSEINEGADIDEIEVIGGVTRLDPSTDSFSPDDLQERTILLDLKVDGQILSTVQTIYSNDIAEYVTWAYDRDPSFTSPVYVPRSQALQQWAIEHRYNELGVSQDYIEGNLKNVTQVTTGFYIPVTPLDTLVMSFRSGTYDTKHYNIVRMSFNPRNNIINFVGKNIIETQGTYSVP